MDHAKREKMKKRIAALIAQAESTSYSEERDTFREKAEALMFQYAIEEAELAKNEGRNLRDSVVKRRVRVSPEGSPFHDTFKVLLMAICRNNRCRVAFWNTDRVSQPVDGLVFGMEQDVEFVETLFASLRLQMARDMEPAPDSDLTFQENLAMLKEAGLTWEEAHHVLRKGGLTDKPYERSVGVRYTKVYTDFCEANGRDRIRSTPKTIQRNFADGFVHRVGQRMEENRRRREEQNTGSGTALVPVTNAVDEAFRAGTSKGRGKMLKQKGKFDVASFRRGDEAGKRADLGQTKVRQQPSIGG